LVKRKKEIIASGANFTERKWGIPRGNFILLCSPCERRPRAIKLDSAGQNLGLRMVEPIDKQLANRDRDSDGHPLVMVAFSRSGPTRNALNLLYLNQPQRMPANQRPPGPGSFMMNVSTSHNVRSLVPDRYEKIIY
jgi:hypothetical protein